MRELPLVSVIIPTYNRADFLDETIESVLAQDYQRIEIILLDDGSADDTPAVLRKYGDRLIVERHANMGETLTVNKGFAMAGGRYLCVVNSDDPILPGLIRAGVVALERKPAALAAYPDWREIGPQSETLREVALPDYTLASMLDTFDVAIGPGVVIRREALAVVGRRNPALRYTGDLDYWFRTMLRGPMIHLPRALATHRVHSTAASTTARDAAMAAEVVRLAEATLIDPLCPRDLRGKRRRILARAHFAAMSYCGNNRPARHRHYRAYLSIDPLNLLREATRILRDAAIRIRDGRLWEAFCFLMVRTYFSPWTSRADPGKGSPG